MRVTCLIAISLFAVASAMERANAQPAVLGEVARAVPVERAQVNIYALLEKRKGGKGGGVSIDVDDDDGALQNTVGLGFVALLAVGATAIVLAA